MDPLPAPLCVENSIMHAWSYLLLQVWYGELHLHQLGFVSPLPISLSSLHAGCEFLPGGGSKQPSRRVTLTQAAVYSRVFTAVAVALQQADREMLRWQAEGGKEMSRQKQLEEEQQEQPARVSRGGRRRRRMRRLA